MTLGTRRLIFGAAGDASEAEASTAQQMAAVVSAGVAAQVTTSSGALDTGRVRQLLARAAQLAQVRECEQAEAARPTPRAGLLRRLLGVFIDDY